MTNPIITCHAVTAAAGAVRWGTADPAITENLADRKLFGDWTPPRLEALGEGPLPTFSWIAGVTCAVVVKLDDATPAISSLSYQAGQVLELGGDATGFSLVVPDVTRSIEAAAEPSDLAVPMNLSFLGDYVEETMFRSVPRLHDVFCGVVEYADDEAVTDLDDYYNMAFKTWADLSGATGVTFTEVWRSGN